ncbi:hypothetical protein BN938_0531 [Mucinivorans hirudinis]|uniref:Uncharacterized protein n=1 Tax=Mucinivorans hirudinis TaxID=1433126 RepID=A0A060R6F6_9BACT|nr:hypothetical protein BN938_0531 [Mucinivorans hirudinis]
MVSVYINGNITPFRGMYQELDQEAQRLFIRYLFNEANPRYTEEIILATI